MSGVSPLEPPDVAPAITDRREVRAVVATRCRNEVVGALGDDFGAWNVLRGVLTVRRPGRGLPVVLGAFYGRRVITAQ